jgi:hypothetical protein
MARPRPPVEPVISADLPASIMLPGSRLARIGVEPHHPSFEAALRRGQSLVIAYPAAAIDPQMHDLSCHALRTRTRTRT